MLVQDEVDTTDDVLRTLNPEEVDGLLDTGGGEHASGRHGTMASGDVCPLPRWVTSELSCATGQNTAMIRNTSPDNSQ